MPSSLRRESATSKVVHLVRHAEGTHNLNEIESKLPLHFDATLTPKGMDQCRRLAELTRTLDVDAVLVSPMTRCLETARLSFPHLYHRDGDDGARSRGNRYEVPFIAHEEWRETVNYLCDSRRTRSTLEGLYPRVDFDNLMNDNDPIWDRYEGIFGCHATHTSHRESNDPLSLCDRARMAWGAILDRPERNLALVGHSAFFMHMFTPLFPELEGVVVYEDEDVEELMTKSKFDNCELRSVLVDIPM
jgi:broad specificity phosphatase PhoE